MHKIFNYKTLAVATASMMAATVANAAGLDRSGQDITAFLQDGTYAEAVYTYIDADVSGKDTSGNATGDIAEAYDFFRYGVKTDINDTFSIGVLYDEPFGAAVKYGTGNDFSVNASSANDNYVGYVKGILAAQAEAAGGTREQGIQQAIALTTALPLATVIANPAAAAAAGAAAPALAAAAAGAIAATQRQAGQATNVEIRTENVSLLLGAKLGTNKNFQVYGGPAAQRLNGEVHLRGPNYLTANGYDAKIQTDTTLGWVAGVAYSKPEIGLRASLTYRSETEHNTQIAEVLPMRNISAVLQGNTTMPGTTTQDFSVTLPESYNLDFQTGLNPTTLLTARVRYVPWGDFQIRPTLYTQASGLPIVSYSDDQWLVELGLGKKINDKLSVQGSVGWDSGAGNPATTLGPVDGYYSVGLGAKYNVTPEWSVSLGGKYFMFGDADAQLPTKDLVGKFENNNGYAVGLKVAYQKR
ncbi:MAG: hypothetical protein Q4G13_05025 [Moraxella sp.]|nr:hypothetical protein [Moraxella sp.]